MLERACQAVEQAAEGGGVFPEVLFEVARHWYEMAEETGPASLELQVGNNSQSVGNAQRRDTDSPSMASAASNLSQVSVTGRICHMGFKPNKPGI